MRTIKPPFPPTIYEGYELDMDPYDHDARGWYPADVFAFDLGSCAYGMGDSKRRDWIIRRTDFGPKTGEIIASEFVPRDEAIKAGEEWCVKHGLRIPHYLRTAAYDTPEEIEANEADHKHSEDKIEGRL